MICEWCDDEVEEWEEFEESRMHRWCWEEANEIRLEDGDDRFMRMATVVFIVTMLVAGVLFAWVLPEVIGAEVVSEQECNEDEPCWDCRTMGNFVCGEQIEGVLFLCDWSSGMPACTARMADGTELAPAQVAVPEVQQARFTG